MHGGSWTFRVSKSIGPEFWNQVQLLAIGEKLEEALDESETPSPEALTGFGCSRLCTGIVAILDTDYNHRRPAMWCWFFCPLQRTSHHHLAPRVIQAKIRRWHTCLHQGQSAPGASTQVRKLLLQTTPRPRWIQDASRVAGRPRIGATCRGVNCHRGQSARSQSRSALGAMKHRQCSNYMLFQSGISRMFEETYLHPAKLSYVTHPVKT